MILENLHCNSVCCFLYTDSFSDPKIKSEIRFRIDQLFRENNVSIPFPQRDIHIINKTL